MLTLKNNQLTVELLDPVADHARFGTRYCTGGYIFQIHDAARGPLLSGPTYPDSFNWFDGQGIPDAFNLAPLQAADGGSVALILGIGLCDTATKVIQEMCQWSITAGENYFHFATRHRFQNWSVGLERIVTLCRRTVRSETWVHNVGECSLPLRWFPHPFFPQLPAGEDELIKLNLPVGLAENPAYTMAANGFLNRQGWPWTSGYGLGLDHQSPTNLIVLQRHPQLGQLTGRCSYVPGFLLIWGNPQTFSWEPYLERTLGAGQQYRWHIDYDF